MGLDLTLVLATTSITTGVSIDFTASIIVLITTTSSSSLTWLATLTIIAARQERTSLEAVCRASTTCIKEQTASGQ